MGLGLWGLNWAQNIVSEIPNVETVAWVDADKTARDRAIAAGLDESRMFASFEDAMSATEADVLLATVPLQVHFEAVRLGLEAGLHVLVEKPFAENRQDALAMIELAKTKGKILAVNQNYRFFPALLKVRELIEKSAIGKPQAMRIDFMRLFDDGYRYFHLAEPLLSDMAIHHFDAMRFVLQDEPVAVSCTSWSEPGTPFEGPPAASALIRFSSGTIVRYDGSWSSRGPITTYGANWQLDGTTGTLKWTFRGDGNDRMAHERISLFKPGEETVEPVLKPIDYWDRAGVLAAFADMVEGGASVPTVSLAADNLKSLDLMFGLIASASQNGVWLERNGDDWKPAS